MLKKHKNTGVFYILIKHLYCLVFIYLFSFTVLADFTELEFKDLSDLPRKALIIGNSHYEHGILVNAEHDARDISESLLGLGFNPENIMLGIDLDKKSTRHMLREFSENLKQSAGVGLFFYAGHGAQYQNEDYIIPVNSQIETEDEINDEGIRVSDILEKMEDQSDDRLNIVILDACRNNPFPRDFKRSMGSTGLKGIEAPLGSLIAYATGKGMLASDGDNRNGLYTKHLLANMSKPGLSLAEIFIRTRAGVMKESGNKQRPWEETAVTGNFYFLPSQSKTPIRLPQKSTDIKIEKKSSASRLIATHNKPTTKTLWTDPITNITFVWISAKPGCFMMGSPTGELGRDTDEKQHRSCINKGYWMGKYEVTQAQWKKVMGRNPSKNTSFFSNTKNFPVENVSWIDAQQFIKKLNDQDLAQYRLPTEAEWEYAARAGTLTPFYTGACIAGSEANYQGEYAFNYCGAQTGRPLKKTSTVGRFTANAFGLHDMAGNIWEWTCSSYDKNYTGMEEKCASENDNNYRVLRGGSWNYSSKYLRSAVRFRYIPSQKDPAVGFRLVRVE